MSAGAYIVMVPIDHLLIDPIHVRIYGPTTVEVDPSLATLGQGIRELGQVPPIIVSRGTPDVPDLTIVSGVRRFVGSGLAGLREVPVMSQTFSSAAEMRRWMVFYNQNRVKTLWQLLMERIVATGTYRHEAKKRQRQAGGAKRPSAATRDTTNAHQTSPRTEQETQGREPTAASETEDDARNLADDCEAPGAEAAAEAEADAPFEVVPPAETSSPAEDKSGVPDGVRSQATGTPTFVPKEPKTSGSATSPETSGEALKKAARALGVSENTLRLTERLYAHACKLQPDDPSASEVAARLRDPNAKFETVARDFGLTPERTATRNGDAASAEPSADPYAAARALRRHVRALMPTESGLRPGALPPTLSAELHTTVQDVVALLAATTMPTLRLMHECPRLGPSRPALRPEQVLVNEKLLREAIRDAMADKMSSSDIAARAGIQSGRAQQAFAAWCNNPNTPLRKKDLLRLVRWVEVNHSPASEPQATSSLPDDSAEPHEVA